MTPEVAVVVASHDRPLRLRWLLNALEEQTLERERFEVIVVHDSQGTETEELLRTHPLAAAGVLRHRSYAPGPGPAQKRNTGWREARAPLIAFTDDDCRPPEPWLANLLAAAHANPGAIVQGSTRPDPDELELALRAPLARSLTIDPPNAWGETANILYPRALLETLGGFDETFPVAAGEDTDLYRRALAGGARCAGAPEALNHHCVEVLGARKTLKRLWRWRFLPAVVKRHPELRDPMPLRIFWKPRHALFPLVLAALPLARRRPLAALALALPWALAAKPSYGSSPRGLLRSASELPTAALVDAVEIAACARGSVDHRSLLL